MSETPAKITVSENELLEILNKMLAKYDDSEDCHFNSVNWHEKDEHGVNWSINYGSSGRHISTCKKIIDAVLLEASKLYLLPE